MVYVVSSAVPASVTTVIVVVVPESGLSASGIGCDASPEITASPLTRIVAHGFGATGVTLSSATESPTRTWKSLGVAWNSGSSTPAEIESSSRPGAPLGMQPAPPLPVSPPSAPAPASPATLVPAPAPAVTPPALPPLPADPPALAGSGSPGSSMPRIPAHDDVKINSAQRHANLPVMAQPLTNPSNARPELHRLEPLRRPSVSVRNRLRTFADVFGRCRQWRYEIGCCDELL